MMSFAWRVTTCTCVTQTLLSCLKPLEAFKMLDNILQPTLNIELNSNWTPQWCLDVVHSESQPRRVIFCLEECPVCVTGNCTVCGTGLCDCIPLKYPWESISATSCLLVKRSKSGLVSEEMAVLRSPVVILGSGGYWKQHAFLSCDIFFYFRFDLNIWSNSIKTKCNTLRSDTQRNVKGSIIQCELVKFCLLFCI